jgi:hypothetical protein
MRSPCFDLHAQGINALFLLLMYAGSRRGGLAVPPPAPTSQPSVPAPQWPPIASLSLEDPPRPLPSNIGGSTNTASKQAGPPSLDEIDSKGYLLDIVNLSVDLDPEDDDDEQVHLPYPRFQPKGQDKVLTSC